MRNVTTIAIVLVVALSMLLSGCHQGSHVRHAQLAPDGVSGVFVQHDGWIAWLLGVARETRDICWFNVDAPDQVKSVRVGTQVVSALDILFRNDSMLPTGRERLVFSPDSRHVAYVGKDVVICSPEGELWKLLKHPHNVEDLTWLSDAEVAYAIIEGPPDDSNSRAHELRVYRQQIRTSQDAAEEILRVDFYGRPLVRWSPCGRYLAYFRLCEGPCYVLDVQTKGVRSFGSKDTPINYISWRPDGSALLCSGSDESTPAGTPPSHDLEHSFLLIETETGTSQRWRYSESFPDTRPSPTFDLADVWTSDNRYVVATYDWIHPALLEPQSRDWIARSDELYEAFHRFSTDDLWSSLSIGPLSVPGWVYVRIPAGARRTEGVYAMNYDGTEFVRIADGWDWAVTPDGTRSVEVDDEGNVSVREISLPAAPGHAPSGATQLPPMTAAEDE